MLALESSRKNLSQSAASFFRNQLISIMAVGHVTFLKLAAGLVILIASAVMHMRKESSSLRQQITIITSENVESLLSPYREVIGADYQGYKNHVLRVISYTRHLLPDLATFTKNQKEIEVRHIRQPLIRLTLIIPTSPSTAGSCLSRHWALDRL